MSRLLNDTKGISPNKDIKIIFTSNLTNLSRIDQALTRPGRCFAQINFDKITVEQGNKIREELKLDKIDLNQFSEDKEKLAWLKLLKNIKSKTMLKMECSLKKGLKHQM